MQTHSCEVLCQRVVFVWSLVGMLRETTCAWPPLPSVSLVKHTCVLGPRRLFFVSSFHLFNRSFVSISFQGRTEHINGVCVEMRVPNNPMSWTPCSPVEHPPGVCCGPLSAAHGASAPGCQREAPGEARRTPRCFCVVGK